MASSILAGAVILVYTLFQLDVYSLWPGYIVFSPLTLAFASRVQVRIPGVKSHISVSDTFIFIAILVFGGNAGILLATLDTTFSSAKVSKTRLTHFFNISVSVVTTFVTVWCLRTVFGPLKNLGSLEFTTQYVAAVCLMGMLQYVTNSGLIAVCVALRAKKPVWRMWKDNFLWTSITYFAGASAAGIVDKLVANYGLLAVLSALPMVGVVYFTYTTYLKNVESASMQAEQAEDHVKQLSHYIAEQERVSRALKESEEYFRNAFDHAAGMAVINPDGQWKQVNDSLCNMLGYSEKELLAQGFQAITHPGDLGNDLSNLRQLLDKKVPNYQLEKRYCHKLGDTIWVLQRRLARQ